MRSKICRTSSQPRCVVVLLLVLSAPMIVSCESNDTAAMPAAVAGSWAEELDSQNSQSYGDNPDVLLLPGLMADRKHQLVDLYAAATGPGADSAIDVLITSQGKQMGSELAVTFAESGDIQQALEFIGMTAGHPVDVDRMQYWPKGERVTATVSWSEPGGVQFTRSERIERLIVDKVWNTTLPEQGFRFVGVPADANGSTADVLTCFNSRSSVLEVAYLVDRRTVSGRLFANPEYSFAVGQALKVRLRPEFRNGRSRVLDYALNIRPGSGSDSGKLSRLTASLIDGNAATVVDSNFEGVFVFLQKAIEDGREPFLDVSYDDALPASSVREVARFIRQFLIPQQIRFEPGAAQLYYSAFLPDESWRDPDRRQRGSQPIEIHWERSADRAFAGAIVQYAMAGDAGQVSARVEFSGMQEFESAIRDGQPWSTDAVFIMVDPTQPYGQIRAVYNRIRDDFPNVYVFM